MSLFYNRSTDFQPAANRVDLYGEALAPPNGVTKDMGILLETKDGKYSLKINKYENTSINASSSAIDGSWYLGSMQSRYANWANRFVFHWYSDTPDLHPEWVIGVDWQAEAAYYGRAPGEDRPR